MSERESEREREGCWGNVSCPVRALSAVTSPFVEDWWGGSLDLEVGHHGELVPLHSLSAQVKVLKAEGYATQIAVLSQRLCTEHAQLKFPLLQGFLTVATVHQLRIKTEGSRLLASE